MNATFGPRRGDACNWSNTASKKTRGRLKQVNNEQAQRYDFRLGCAAISLSSVVRTLHDIVAEKAVKVASDDDLMMHGSGSPAHLRKKERSGLPWLGSIGSSGTTNSFRATRPGSPYHWPARAAVRKSWAIAGQCRLGRADFDASTRGHAYLFF